MLDSLESQFNGTLATFDLRYGTTPTYPTLSESLIVSLGGVLQEPGAAYYVSSDKIVFSEAPAAGTECWILLYSQYGASTSSAPLLTAQATGEPMGFEDRTHSTVSFTNGTRTFSIGPNTAAGHSSYAVWTKGTKRTISATLSVQVGATTGLYYIYFDAFGVLQSKTTYFTWDTETPVAYVYWNSTTSSAPFIADERHGVVLDWQTHEYLHRTRGAVIAEGFSISAYTTTGNGNVDAHAQFDLGNGTFFDEDLEVAITHSATPTVGTFTQVLTGAAELPVFYLSGSSGAWVRDTPTEYACKQSATTLQYNLLSGSTWSTTPATNNRYVVSWVVATNDITAPIIVILGQNQHTGIGSAEAVKFGDLVLTNFPIVEFRPLWKVIFRTSTGFTNTPNALIANVLDLRQLSETGEAGTVVSDHGLLSGLADDDHTQYLHTTLDRAEISANISTTGNLGGANLTLTGELRGPSTLVIDPVTVGDDTGLVRIKGDLEVLGATTNINSTTLVVEDKNIILGDTASPADALADGGGITLKGSTDKTINWVNATNAWTLSEHVSIASAKEYRIAGTKVLDATGLGTAVVSSSLTSVGTITSGTWQGGAIADTYLGTIATAGKVSNSATTATSALGANTIVARDASNNFTAGTITAALTGAASANVLKAGDTMTGVLAVTAGTAALPGIAVSGDTNTGIYSPGANQLAIATGGVGRIIVDASGNVNIDSNTLYVDAVNNRAGINTTGPNGILDIKKSGASTTPNLVLTSGGPGDPSSVDPSIQFAASAFESLGTTKIMSTGAYGSRALAFHTGTDGAGTEKVRIDSSGRLLVGTNATTASCKLNVDTGINCNGLNVSGIGGFFNAANKVGIDNNGGVSRFYSSGANSSTRGSYDFRITDSVGTLDTSAVVIDSSGNLGVGIVPPSTAANAAKLHVYSSSSNAAVIEQTSTYYHVMRGKVIQSNSNAATVPLFTASNMYHCGLMVEVVCRGTHALSGSMWKDTITAWRLQTNGTYQNSGVNAATQLLVAGTHTSGTLSWTNVSTATPTLNYTQGANGYILETIDVYVTARDGAAILFNTSFQSFG